MMHSTPPRREHDALLMLGQAVLRARARAALSQRGLEARTGVHQSAISRMERGVAPGMALEKFARVAAVLADYLLVSDPVLPQHRFGPSIPAFWLAHTLPSDRSSEGDAASRLGEVGARALASLVDAGGPADTGGPRDAGEAGDLTDLMGLGDRPAVPRIRP